MGHARTTLADVAAAAGVSVSTASLAFSGAGPISADTKAKVLAAAERLGYSGPNPLGRSLRSGRSGIVGVVVGDNLARAFRDPVQVRVLDGLVEDLGERGLGVLLITAADSWGVDAQPDPLLVTAAMDVVVLLFGGHANDPSLAAAGQRGLPVVIAEAPEAAEALAAAHVRIEDRAGSAVLLTHLRELGHERIGCVTLPIGGRRRLGEPDAARLAGIGWPPPRNRLAAFADAGIEPAVVVEARASLVEEGRAAGHLLLNRPDRPTAIFAQSDLLAAGVLLAARERGIQVPQELSVAGFDGLDLPWLAPDVLTTVEQPLTEKGRALGRQVGAILAGEAPETIVLGVELRVGTTTGPPIA